MSVNFGNMGAGSGNLERDMREELRSVLSSESFLKSPVMSQLLTFLVDATLRGEGDRLKAYSVAVEGLGRHSDFDAAADSYPRVQVGRLRKALEAHYAHRPAQSANCLNIPAGGYRVRLSLRRVAYPDLSQPGSENVAMAPPAPPPIARTPAIAAESRAPAWRMPVIIALVVVGAALLTWFQTWNGRQSAPQSPQVLVSSVGSGALAASTNSYIADGLRRSWVLRVTVGAPATSDPAFRYEIQTQPQAMPDGQTELFVRVIDREHGGVIWSNNEPLPTDPEARDETLARLIARLSSPFGIIARTERSRLAGDDSPGYACMLLFDEYFRVRDPAIQKKVQSCIMKDATDPRLVPAVEGARAIVIFAKAARPAERAEALRRARALAALSVDRYWESPEAQFTNATLAFYAGECTRGGMFADRALEANPYNPNMRGFLGLLTYPCDKTKARALLERARALEPDGPANFRIPLLVLAAEGDVGLDVDAIATEMQTNTRSSPAVQALGLALIASAKGDRASARRHWLILQRLAPQRNTSADEFLRPFILSDSLRAIAIRQLTKGGALQPNT